jgi:hypothetical protein
LWSDLANIGRPVWHYAVVGANNDPLVAIIREVAGQILDERDLSGRVEPV